MGRAKVVNVYNDRYCGKMSDKQCDVLEQIIAINEDGGYLPDLIHSIYDLPNSLVIDIIEEGDSFNNISTTYEKPYGTLRDYQTLAVAFMYSANRCIIGDSVGMGKTVELAGFINLVTKRRQEQGRDMKFLALTEKNICSQFREELVKFTGDYVQLIPNGEKKTIEEFKYRNPYEEDLSFSVVGTHALLTTAGFIQWLEQCRTMGEGFPFDTLIVDESSCLGGTNTQAVNGFKAISKYFTNIIFLNATPFETKLQVFYNQLNLLDKDLLPTKTNFTKEYCIMDYRGMYPRPTGKYRNQEQFKRLVGYRYFARTRKDRGAIMQDCDGKVLISELSPIQKEWLKKSQLHRMVYDCPSHIDPSIEFNSENIPKLASLNQLLKEECADAETIIIFAQFKEAQKHLSKWLHNKGYTNRVLNGDTPANERKEVVKGFKNNEFNVLITNVQKGLNFGNCDYCIFYSFDPNPSSMIQFEGRITRDIDIIGKHVYILCSSGPEFKAFDEVLRQRAKATSEFTNTDYSVVMDILLEGFE
jgi:superfamily II DNA or RNA helicase